MKTSNKADVSIGMNSKGTITVFLTLSLTIILSLMTAVIASARDRSMRMRCENAMDLGLLSVFGEYNRELLDKFDLYFIDSAYGGEGGGGYHTGERLKEYIQYNLNPAKGQPLTFSRDMFGLSVDELSVNMESLATDSGARVYKRQAIRYIKDKYGLSLIESLKKTEREYRQYGVEDYDPEKERLSAQKEMEKAEDVVDEDGNKVEYKNPVQSIEDDRATALEGILGELDISGKRLDGSSLASERSLETGSGIVANTEDLDSFTNDLLFDCYLTDKFSCFCENKNNGGMDYEVEYILHGKNTDRENLSATVASLMLIRYGTNCMYIHQNEGLKKQAEAAAAAVSVLLFSPELADPLTEIILFSWAFAETCVDVRRLLDGKRVPLMKSEETWLLRSLPMALDYKEHMKDEMDVGLGLDYKGYLGLFLMLTGEEKKLLRSIDMIECDMRSTKGNENFKMDNCIEFLEARAGIKSRFGREYTIERYFGYMDMPKMAF